MPRLLLRFVLNKYTLTLVGAVVWMLFFDSYNLEAQWRRREKIAQMQADVRHYQNELLRLQAELDILRDDPAEVERLARERYQMRRSGEDVYVVN